MLQQLPALEGCPTVVAELKCYWTRGCRDCLNCTYCGSCGGHCPLAFAIAFWEAAGIEITRHSCVTFAPLRATYGTRRPFRKIRIVGIGLPFLPPFPPISLLLDLPYPAYHFFFARLFPPASQSLVPSNYPPLQAAGRTAGTSAWSLTAGGYGELPAHVGKDLVQLRRIPSHIALAGKWEFEEGRGKCALRGNSRKVLYEVRCAECMAICVAGALGAISDKIANLRSSSKCSCIHSYLAISLSHSSSPRCHWLI